MYRFLCWYTSLALLAGLAADRVGAAEPLHRRIDALILEGADGKDVSPLTSDAEFLRRVSLDLAGRIPSAQEVRDFLADKSADRRSRKIDELLASPEYAGRMQELFHVMLMERLGDHDLWAKYLRASFAANKPWDQMAREILRADPKNEAVRGAAFFYSKRLENYGQNPVDYPALTRDVGRLFLGKDLRCAECHDHLFVDDYKQQDFQGLFAFFQNTMLVDANAPAVGEKPTTKKTAFMSVFVKAPRETAPRLPGGKELTLPEFKKGEEYLEPPDRKTRSPGVPRFSLLEQLSVQLPRAENRDFCRNIANRLWFVLMGRGLVHPLDLHHADNPASHPKLLDLLADEMAAHSFDIRWMLRELALTQAYQRSSLLPAGREKADPARFLTALEKRLSAEQLVASMTRATGMAAKAEALRAKFVKAFANPPREPEDEIAPSLEAALFVLNDPAVLALLEPARGSLVERAGALPDAKAVEEVYLSVLSRPPTAEEQADALAFLKQDAAGRGKALGQLAWALLASTEFTINH